jgi:hypothetical protein
MPLGDVVIGNSVGEEVAEKRQGEGRKSLHERLFPLLFYRGPQTSDSKYGYVGVEGICLVSVTLDLTVQKMDTSPQFIVEPK